MSELIEKEQAAISNVTTPVQLLNLAIQQGADIEKLEKLMILQNQWESNEAKKAYHRSIAEFKTESIDIIKNKKVSFGNTNYKHATLDHILDITTPILAKYGLSHNWSVNQTTDGNITVTCVLTHSAGYSESVNMTSTPDTSGSKNSIQQVGSTITYLQRYTFLSITGLAARDEDDDGQNAGEREGFAEGLAYGMACYKLKEIIEEIKDQLADDNIQAAAEAMAQLSNNELMTIRRAPTKGGIFTIDEVKIMKSAEWKEAYSEAVKNSPDIDRSV